MSFMFCLLYIARYMLAKMVRIINVTYYLCIHISRIFFILNKPCTSMLYVSFLTAKNM